MKVAVIGATGMVGQVMLRVLEERNFPVSELIPVASERSIGKEVNFRGKQWKIYSMDDAISMKPDLALFSAGGDVSLEHAPRFAEKGTLVIDNSSAWRMDPDKKLIIPEVNASIIEKSDRIIANPNCSTIQMVLVLNPLHLRYSIRRVIVSTYQSVTGTGQQAVKQMFNERQGIEGERVYPYTIDLNVIPQIDDFLENAYTKEEMKMVNETKKIMGNEDLRLSATAVRIPVMGGHSESVNVEFNNPYTLEEVRTILSASPGILVVDDPSQLAYPMPKDAEGKDETHVGRIRRDESQPNTLNMWIVADNLRKGAATNAIQIAEYCLNNNLLPSS